MPERCQRRNPFPSSVAPLSAALLALGQAFYFWRTNVADLGPGLPIDDAYIFLRYAHNLAAGYGFSFNPGEVSFGCTSLVWPVLIAGLQNLLPATDPVALSFWLGAILFSAAAAGTACLLAARTGRAWTAFAGGIMIASSPYLLMNAISGMETPLTLFLLIILAALVTAEAPRPLVLGLLAGLMTVNRPESLYFGPVAATLWLALSVLRRRPEWKPAALLLAGWAVAALPVAFYIHAHTGSFLPTTYLGKIIAGTPDALHRPLQVRLFWSLRSLGDGGVKLAWPMKALAPALAIGLVYQAATAVRAARRPDGPLWPRWGWALLAGYIFLPAVYGFSFPVYPPFGGYYVRYIAPVQAVFIVVGLTGLAALARALAEKYLVAENRRRLVAVAAAVAMIAFQGWLWSFQFPAAREVFSAEVRLNTGLRREAGQWLHSHVRPGEKVMVGYTGLGAIGYFSDRYCLDVGALINPDIFPYYRGTGYNIARRQEAIIRYMTDRHAGWYVTFAYPKDKTPPLADPTTDPRFVEAARIGAPGEPNRPYDQIRIYHFNQP